MECGGKKFLLLHGGEERYCLTSQQRLHDAEEFLFENVFTENATQENVYNVMAKPVVDRAIEGFNGTIMAYGQTGTGKTHTICGSRDKGIIPRAFKDVFYRMKEMKHTFKVFLSVLEIYNEHAYDLLSDRFSRIGIGRDKTKQVIPRNLKTVHVSNMHQLDKLLKKAWRNRIVSETPMNDASSRSHCIFSLHLHQWQNSTVMVSKVHMIDLSGSEKLGKRRPSAVLLNETRHINLSLHYIELVIRALCDKNRDHIPYRNSMITSFLRDSLGGNSNTVMVFTLSLEPMFFEETVLTCRFAQRVSLISNKMKKQISQNTDIELIKTESNGLMRSNHLEPIESEHEILVEGNGSPNHKGITCKLDSASTSSCSSCQCDSDKMSIFDDEDLTKYIDELLADEDLSSLHYCHEKHQKEERNCILELKSIQNTLNSLMEVTLAFKKFSPRNEEAPNKMYCVYEQLGLSLPTKSPITGKLYKSSEREEFIKFLSNTLNINNFKNEYYDEYCDLLVKEYQASSALSKSILDYEKSKTKIHSKMASMTSDKLDRNERLLKIKESKVEERENAYQEHKNERISLVRKLEEFKAMLIKQFHNEWLPEKENIIYSPTKKSEKSDFQNNNKLLPKEVKTENGKVPCSVKCMPKVLGKSKSNITEYRGRYGDIDLPGKKMKVNNVTSDSKICSPHSSNENTPSSEE